jgi:sugar lactone lactonase YvrE
VHCYSDSKVSFDNSVFDASHEIEVRQREFAWMNISGKAAASPVRPVSPVIAPGAKVERVATGFFNISGGAVDAKGDFYFVDPKWQTIYRWSAANREISTVRDNPLDPVQLFFDKSGDLIVISYAGKGSVYTFNPESADDEITLLKAEPAGVHPQMMAMLPVDYWRNENDFPQFIIQTKPYQFISPDGTTFVPTGDDFVTGRLYYGSKMHDVLRAFGLSRAVPGQPFYVSDEEEEKTYSAKVEADGTLSTLTLFAERGGEGLAWDKAGNVYIAAGQIYVYDSAGKQIDEIDVPERPSQLMFGGADGKTLFIAARASLYTVQTRYGSR